METKNEPEPVVEDVIEEEEVEEQPAPETEDPAELKSRIKQLEEKAIAQRERTKILRQEMAKLAKKPAEVKTEPTKTAGELDDTQLDYLDLKGITESEDIAIIQKVMQRTGQTVREALKDDYVQTKLKANTEQRAVQNATPSGTKRSGTPAQGLDQALAKFEQTGELPQDFQLRAAVVNAKMEKSNTNKPSWH
jgi:hypothetical protein